MNAHVFVSFSIKLGILFLKHVALDPELVDVIPQRVVLLFRLYESSHDLVQILYSASFLYNFKCLFNHARISSILGQ